MLKNLFNPLVKLFHCFEVVPADRRKRKAREYAKAYNLGYIAGFTGKAGCRNPYFFLTKKYVKWLEGFCEGNRCLIEIRRMRSGV